MLPSTILLGVVFSAVPLEVFWSGAGPVCAVVFSVIDCEEQSCCAETGSLLSRGLIGRNTKGESEMGTCRHRRGLSEEGQEQPSVQLHLQARSWRYMRPHFFPADGAGLNRVAVRVTQAVTCDLEVRSGSAAKFKSRSSPHCERRLLKPGQQTVRHGSASESSPIPGIAHVQPDTSVYNYLYNRPLNLRPYLYFSSIRHSMLEVVLNVLPSITTREHRAGSAGPPRAS